MNAALPSVPPPDGMVKVGEPVGQDMVPPVPPLLVKAVVKVALVTEPAEVAVVAVVAFPLKAPENVVADIVPVEGS